MERVREEDCGAAEEERWDEVVGNGFGNDNRNGSGAFFDIILVFRLIAKWPSENNPTPQEVGGSTSSTRVVVKGDNQGDDGWIDR